MLLQVIITGPGERVVTLRQALSLRSYLLGHVEPAVEEAGGPLQGVHRDEQGRPYFEMSAQDPQAVERAIDEYPEQVPVELRPFRHPHGEACQNCGNMVTGEFLPTVCPNCGFRDISACPHCDREVPRKSYRSLGGRLHQCPECQTRLRMRFTEPMFLADGSYNQPLVVLEEVRVQRV